MQQQQQQPPPTPPPQTPPPPYTASPLKQIRFSPLQILSKYSKNQQGLNSDESLLYSSKLRSEEPILKTPEKTKPIIWFAAILCMIVTLLIIFFGVAVLIIFLAVQPKTPLFDIPGASLTAIYFNSPQFIGNDMTFLANFSNPNRKLEVRYEHLNFELSFAERLIAAQAIQPFSQKPGESKLLSVHLLSSLAYAPPNLAMEFQKQGQRNRVVYQLKGTFRVRIKLGAVHYSYWLHGDCQLHMASPPNGVLIAHSCRTKRKNLSSTFDSQINEGPWFGVQSSSVPKYRSPNSPIPGITRNSLFKPISISDVTIFSRGKCLQTT